MLNFLSIILIIFILFFIAILKRKYIFNAFNKNKLYSIKEIHNENNIMTSSEKNKHYQISANKNSEFYKRKLREKMNILFKGSAEDKLKALNLAEDLADKSTLPILRKGLKEMNLQIVERSANLIRKFK